MSKKRAAIDLVSSSGDDSSGDESERTTSSRSYSSSSSSSGRSPSPPPRKTVASNQRKHVDTTPHNPGTEKKKGASEKKKELQKKPSSDKEQQQHTKEKSEKRKRPTASSSSSSDEKTKKRETPKKQLSAVKEPHAKGKSEKHKQQSSSSSDEKPKRRKEKEPAVSKREKTKKKGSDDEGPAKKKNKTRSRKEKKSSDSSSEEDDKGKQKKKGKKETTKKGERRKELEELLSDGRSVRSVLLMQNKRDMLNLHDFAKGEIASYKIFTSNQSERLAGQYPWWTKAYNTRPSNVLCKLNCAYCIVVPMMERFKARDNVVLKIPDIEDNMPCNKTNVDKEWKKTSDENRHMYCFPSTSDIFAENAKDFAEVCAKIAKAGHEIVFMTKPTMAATKEIVAELEKVGVKSLKHKLFVYISITSDDDEVTHRFEPLASLFEERCKCLEYYAQNGFSVHVMMEPYLVEPIPLMNKMLVRLPKPAVDSGIEPPTIVIGRMRYTEKTKFNGVDERENEDMKKYLDKLYTDKKAMELLLAMEGKDNVFLTKDSMSCVVRQAKINQAEQKKAKLAKKKADNEAAASTSEADALTSQKETKDKASTSSDGGSSSAKKALDKKPISGDACVVVKPSPLKQATDKKQQPPQPQQSTKK
jgi:hypothetical protein